MLGGAGFAQSPGMSKHQFSSVPVQADDFRRKSRRRGTRESGV